MFRRKPAPKTGVYEGRVVWSMDGPFPSHIAVTEGGEPDHSTRLIWIDDAPHNPNDNSGHYEYYEDGQPTHQARYHKRHIELPAGGDN